MPSAACRIRADQRNPRRLAVALDDRRVVLVDLIEQGEATFVFNGRKRKVRDADAVVIPAGTHHNVVNSSKTETLKLYTIYSPPNHPAGTVHKTKADAEAAEH